MTVPLTDEARLIIRLSRQRLTGADVDAAGDLIRGARAGFDWPVFLDQALQHRVAPLLSRSMDNVRAVDPSLRLDPTVSAALRVQRSHQATVSAVLRGELGTLLAAVAVTPARVVVRKGAHLAWHVYEDPSLRPMSDIDLLVAPVDVPALVEILTGLGYRQGTVRDGRIEPLGRREALFWRMYGADLPGFQKRVDEPVPVTVTIDVSVSTALPGASDYDVPVEDLIGRANPRRCAAYTGLLLDPADTVLDLCLHTYKNSTVFRFMRLTKHRRLLKYVDLAEFVDRTGGALDWDVLLDRVAAYRAGRPVLYTLAHLDRLFPGTVPAGVLSRLAAGTPDLAGFLAAYGQWDLPQPRRWTVDLEDRYFSRGYDAEIPDSRSLV